MSDDIHHRQSIGSSACTVYEDSSFTGIDLGDDLPMVSPKGVDGSPFFQCVTLQKTPKSANRKMKKGSADDWLRNLIGSPPKNSNILLSSPLNTTIASIISDDGSFFMGSPKSMKSDLLLEDITQEELVSLKSVVRALESQNFKLREKLRGLQADSGRADAALELTSVADNGDVLSLKARLGSLIYQNDELTKHIEMLQLEPECKKNDPPGVFEDGIAIICRQPNEDVLDDSSEARDDEPQKSRDDEMESLRSRLAATEMQLTNTTGELSKIKQQNKQLETAAHTLSLELMADRTDTSQLYTCYKNDQVGSTSSLDLVWLLNLDIVLQF
eukprot:scaffold15507_cov74-Cyclotella_meneghiniana.AAC.3